MLKRKRSASASGDERQTKGKGKTERVVERVVIDLTLISDDEDADEAARKSGDGGVMRMDVDGVGSDKEKGKDSSPPPPLLLALPTTQYGQHLSQVEDSHLEPDKPDSGNMEIDCESTTEPAVPPPEELAPALIPTVIKPEPNDHPLPTSLLLSRPLLSHKHLRLVFKKQEGNIVCMACWYVSVFMSIPLFILCLVLLRLRLPQSAC